MMNVSLMRALVVVSVTAAAISRASGDLVRSSTHAPNSNVTNDTSVRQVFVAREWESGFRNVMGAVLQLRSRQEEQQWPRLELSVRVVLATILAAVGASLSSAGGLGGGGLYVPLGNLLLGFDTKTAAALSNFMILGGSLSNMGVNLRQPNPETEGQPLIDFNAALLLEPNMLLGIGLGVICNVMFPAWVITVLLAVTLFYMTIRSVSGGVRRWANESRTMKAAAEEEALQKAYRSGDLRAPLLLSYPDHANSKEADDTRPETDNKAMTLNIRDIDLSLTTSKHDSPSHNQYPLKKMGFLALMWFLFLGVQLLRGGNGKSLLKLRKCGVGYWLLTASQIPLALGLTHWATQRCEETSTTDAQDRRLPVAQKARSVLPVMAFLAGLLGGMLGLGGGMIINPLLLEIGMPPQVTAATCAFMVFFSSSMSVVQYWLLGRIPMAHALLFGSICLCFALMGQIIVKRVIVQYGRPSIIVFSVSAVIGMSAIVMGGFGAYEIVRSYLRGDYMGFHTPC